MNSTYLLGIENLLGRKTLSYIRETHVLIIGLGGVGSWIAESLVRTGISEITLVDLDDLCLSNINRQVHALYSTHGKLKTEVLKARLSDINPELKINLITAYFSEKNAEEILSKPYSAIIDACDDFNAKLLLCQLCFKNKLFLLTIGAAGGKVDPAQIRTGDLTDTTNDRLLSRIRKKLRQEHHFPRIGKFNIHAVWSNERARYPDAQGKLCYESNKLEGQKLDCNLGFGSASFMTGSMAFFAVHSVIKYWQDKNNLNS